ALTLAMCENLNLDFESSNLYKSLIMLRSLISPLPEERKRLSRQLMQHSSEFWRIGGAFHDVIAELECNQGSVNFIELYKTIHDIEGVFLMHSDYMIPHRNIKVHATVTISAIK